MSRKEKQMTSVIVSLLIFAGFGYAFYLLIKKVYVNNCQKLTKRKFA